jgi:hypothetical protein
MYDYNSISLLASILLFLSQDSGVLVPRSQKEWKDLGLAFPNNSSSFGQLALQLEENQSL